MRSLFHRLVLSLATGVIFVFWSEVAFWARPYSGTTLAELAPTTIAYSVAAYFFLATASAFRARSAPGIFLAGALFGWFVEGVIVQTMVEDLPLSISFTGLAWHASITVLVGWWLFPRALARGRVRRLVTLSAAVGVVYGLWAMTWWVEAPPPTPPVEFGAYVLRTTIVLAAAYAIADRLRVPRFAPSRFEWAVLGGLVLAYFAAVTVPAAPLSLVIVPPLFALALAGLRRLKNRDVFASEETSLPHPPPAAYATLLVIPFAATTIYTLGFRLGVDLPTGIALYLIATPLGFGLLAWSLWRAFSPGGAARPAEEGRSGT